MELTAFAQWLNTAFAGYDAAILGLLHRLAEAAGGLLTPLMKLVTLLGEKGLLMLLAAVALMLFARTRRIGVCLFGAVCCGALITNIILKDWVARPRPFETVELFRQYWQFLGAPAEDGFSFPSGHVTAAAAGMTALSLIHSKKWIAPGALWVVLMALSRNYLVAHYPSDVLFAALIGLASGVVAWLITRLIFALLEQYGDTRFASFCLDFDVRDLRQLRRSEGPAVEAKEVQEQPEERGGYVGKHLKQ